MLGTDYHFKSIARGIIDSRDLIYFVSVIAIALMLTIKVVEERR
jgi:ABC-2 type transport system permease protein